MKVVIIGSGHAAITALNTLLQNQDDLDITMLTEDRFPFYPRPAIYKIIRGHSPDDIIRHPIDWYKSKGVDLKLNTQVKKISSTEKKVLTSDNQSFVYDKVLIATGSTPFIPPIPGMLDGPLYSLRSIDDALEIRNKALNCSSKKATILGGGLLSVELAKTLSDIGITPTIIDRSSYLLRKQLDQEGGLFLNKLFDHSLNTRFLFNTQCIHMKRNGEKITIKLKDSLGKSDYRVDFLLNATGVTNDNSLANNSGIKLGQYAIQVDPFMETNIENIYAAGDAVDISSFPGSKFGIIPTAIDQAKIAGINILGNRVPYTGTVPWTTLKVAGIYLTSMGEISPAADVEEKFVIQDYDLGIYRKIFFKHNKLRGAILIGSRENLHELKKLTIRGASYEEVNELIN
ncbi:MAG: NAD(P)/FAD-dependent oxidoreductase [Candidatus Hodarchaeales archaeon]|jgi:nitrite reductase (NADH) large subunit